VVLELLLCLVCAGCLDPCSNCVTAPASGPGTFSQTGPLNQERAFASAALLPNQTSLLIAGGGRVPGYLTRAQIYDPNASSAMFTPDAQLENARANHTATLLSDGHVLVTGGDNGIEALNSSEIYHPASGTSGSFVEAASMFATRTHQTATLLKDGRVLISGGSPAVAQVNVDDSMGNLIRTDVVPIGALNTAELFEPTTGNFVGVFDAMTSARTEHTATLLEDGTVLLVGGADQNGVALASAEIFDSHTMTFTPTAGTLSIARYDHTATLIQCGKGCDFDGDVLIVGGFNNASQTIAQAELYDPTHKSFIPQESLMTDRALHTAIDLDDGSVLIAGGIQNIPSTGFTNLTSAEIFEVSPNSMNAGSFVPAENNLSAMRSGAAAVEIKLGGVSKILESFGGQADFNGAFFSSLPSSDLYDPASMTFSTGPASLPSCTVSSLNPFGCAITRTAHTATVLNDGRVVIIGGYEATRVVLNSTETYDLTSGTFSPAPDLSEARVFQTSSVIMGNVHGGDILIAGGDPPCDGTAQRYDVANNAFVATGPMTSANRCTFFSATPLNDGTILFAGGLDGSTEGSTPPNVLNTAELYNPANDTFTPVGNLNSPRWGHAAVQLTDGSNDVLIVGGANCAASGCNGFLNTAELFDPATKMFTPTTNPLKEPRFFSSVNNLPIMPGPTSETPANGVLIAGGSGDNTAEYYDPATGTFSVTGNMNFIRFFQPGTTLPGQAGLILLTGGSGRNAFANLLPLSSAEIFDPNAGMFCRTGDMDIGRAFHSATAIGTGKDVRVLVAGGLGDNTSLGTAELYTPPLGTGCSASGKTAELKSLAGISEDLRATVTTYLRAMSRATMQR
jgi:hypothetical protein